MKTGQIVEDLRSQILSGELRPGQRLLPVRELARQRQVHRLTAFKAYEELKAAGLVEARVGSGTFVAAPYSRQVAADVLGRVEGTGPMNRFEAVSDEAGLRSLATNVPDPWLFRADEFLLECYELRKASPWVFYYAPPGGAHELCEAIAKHLTARGLPTEPAQILVTGGDSHSLALLLDHLNPQQLPVAIEDPFFIGAKLWFQSRGHDYIPIPRTADGVDLERLRQDFRAFIVSPNYGQVTGWSLPRDQRFSLLEMARKRAIPLIELASSSLASYESQDPSHLAQCAEGNEVILLDDFATSLSPGIGLGYIRAHTTTIRALERRLQHEQQSGTQFVQLALAAYLDRGLLQAHLERVIPRYRARRDRMLSALRFHMPAGTSWSETLGGFSTWVKLPEGVDCEGLYERGLARGVAVARGPMFSDSQEARRHLRLSFGTQEAQAIEEAVKTLAEIVR